MDGFDIFSKIAFGTSFDPKQPRRRKNKLKNAKRNKRKRLEEAELELKADKKPQHNEDLDDSDSSYFSVDKNVTEQIETNNTKKEKKNTKTKSKMQLQKIHQEEITHFRRTHKIYVTGEDVPDPFDNFNKLGSEYSVDSTVMTNIAALNYSVPTPIQMQAIPLMFHNRQILACAPTGSGKTAAFLIPVIHNLKSPKKGGIRAVIIAPTRELVKQIHSFCIKLSEGTELRTLIIEDVNSIKQKPKYIKKHDILITTPNRLIYLLKEDPPVISLNKVEWLIVDECDKLFEAGEQGFRDQLAAIYNACDSASLKRAMFSATYAHEVEEWCKLNLDSLVCVSIGTKNTAVETVKQELLFVGCEGGKLLALRDLLKQGFMPPVLIFVQSKERAKELYSEIAYTFPRVNVIHADLPQEARDSVVASFISCKVWVLICTELMGRGIDFKGVNLVINYDFPPTAISYIHRIGRTGRAGEEGKAITYFTTDDVENLKSIAQVVKNAGCEIPSYIMSIKSKKKKKNEHAKPIRREKISTVPSYEIEKRFKKRKSIQNSIRKKKKKTEVME